MHSTGSPECARAQSTTLHAYSLATSRRRRTIRSCVLCAATSASVSRVSPPVFPWCASPTSRATSSCTLCPRWSCRRQSLGAQRLPCPCPCSARPPALRREHSHLYTNLRETCIECTLAGKPINQPGPHEVPRAALPRPAQLPGDVPRAMAIRLIARRSVALHHTLTVGRVVRLARDDDDCGMLFEDIHRGRSVRPPYPARADVALRGDPDASLSLENCGASEFADAERHLKEVLLERRWKSCRDGGRRSRR
ncbi:hypothetical protein K466DRAFT_322044 [Polyporus arcularius HHB13444]|uniref:Uncharacterized protein n=1 Tax=Polyporus arcularius HHB13444 TaxID=1314778 RepID=A0A5C3NZQ6_9APHY|nr:hypothetical protein K466DRAFT_322044 [Polyporus arcularius HHB13444]